MYNYNYEQELQHWGIKGMKWGVRRYQNADGTLTEKGKKRYARDAKEKEYDKYDESKNTYYRSSKKGRSDLAVDADRYVMEDMERSKRVADSSAGLARELKRVNDKSMRKAPAKRMDLSEMTDKELRDRINRELLEKQYNDMFNPATVSKGRERASKVLDVAGDVLGITGGALAVAVSLKTLMGGKK